jgi:phosphoribosylaminoimidazole (AIR) synthetase
MALAVAEDAADATLDILSSAGEEPLIIGEIRDGGEGGCVLE